MPGAERQPASHWFVLVAGWPGSGKSTLAAALAAELSLPLLAKDEIKEALMEGLGRPGTVASSRRLGKVAVLVMLRAARTCPGAVLDSTWFDYALPLARALPGRLIEVHCTVPVELAMARYRARSGHRHAGHLDGARSDEELWGEPSRPPGLGPVVAVGTSRPVDVAGLAATIAQVLAGRAGLPRSLSTESFSRGPGQPGHDQRVGMVDQLKQFLIGHRAVQYHGIPVPLVQVVAGRDGGIAGAQALGQVRIALEAHAARRLAERDKREHPADDLEHRHLVAERVVLR
jgi:predicted kinase